MANEDGFDRALPRILIHEGGKVDNPEDTGSRTNRGITHRVYNSRRTKSNLPARDVHFIDDMEVAAISRLQYWDAVQGDALPEGRGEKRFPIPVQDPPHMGRLQAEGRNGRAGVDYFRVGLLTVHQQQREITRGH